MSFLQDNVHLIQAFLAAVWRRQYVVVDACSWTQDPKKSNTASLTVQVKIAVDAGELARSYVYYEKDCQNIDAFVQEVRADVAMFDLVFRRRDLKINGYSLADDTILYDKTPMQGLIRRGVLNLDKGLFFVKQFLALIAEYKLVAPPLKIQQDSIQLAEFNQQALQEFRGWVSLKADVQKAPLTSNGLSYSL